MDFYEGRPLVFGHRGAREAAPENTMAAFQKALAMGADGIELDVMLSSDGVPVVCHDFSLERTTNGHGKVTEHALAELRALDAGSHFSREFQGEPIPTLEDVLDAFGDSLRINVELKSISRRDDGLEAKASDLVIRRGLTSTVVFSSFNPLSLWRARRVSVCIPRGLLYSADLPLPLRKAWAAPLLGLQAVHPQGRLVDEGYMRWARRKGYRVNVWTINEPAEMNRLLDLGVDILITDRPDLARETVNRRRQR